MSFTFIKTVFGRKTTTTEENNLSDQNTSSTSQHRSNKNKSKKEGASYKKQGGSYNKRGTSYKKQGGHYNKHGASYKKQAPPNPNMDSDEDIPNHPSSYEEEGTQDRFNAKRKRKTSMYGADVRKSTKSTFAKRSGPKEYGAKSRNGAGKRKFTDTKRSAPKHKDDRVEYSFDVSAILPASMQGENEDSAAHEEAATSSILNTTKTFEDIGVQDPYVLKRLAEQDFDHPTEVQEKSMSVILNGDNLVCASSTGSGKTLAFIIPILIKLIAKEINQAVILSPTREIAMQTQRVLNKFLPYQGISCGLVVGGLDMKEQRRILREYPKIFIATPGRLVHSIQEGKIWLGYTGIVVLDEMDRMLDMGFKDQLEIIYGEFPNRPGNQGGESRNRPHNKSRNRAHNKARIKAPANIPPQQARKDDPSAKVPSSTAMQILAFTATLLPSIQKTIDEGIPNYKKVVIGDGANVNENIDHKIYQVELNVKFSILKKILQELKGKKTIVFFNTIQDTIRLAAKMREVLSDRVLAMHSKKSQDERNTSLNDFKSGRAWLMFATDVAARGLDVYRIEHVINYSVPRNSEEYIHRLGRTGRMSLKGYAITLMEKRETKYLHNIEKLLGKQIEVIKA